MKRMIVMAVSILLALTLAMPVAFGKTGQSEKASGATTEELVTAWWQWALSKPVDDSPFFGGGPTYTTEQCDGTPLSDMVDGTWFLAGTLDGSEVVRICTVPDDTTLFFPIFNVAVFPDPDETEEQVLAQANAFIDSVLDDPEFSLVVTVDGKAVPKGKLTRAEAGLFSGESPLLVSETNPSGSYEAVADGLWLKLPPLSEGEHTISWEVSAPNADFFQSNTYQLTVG